MERMSIVYRLGDATRPVGDGPKVIVHVCNDVGGWGKGFVLAISKRWCEPEREYRRWHHERAPDPLELGRVQFVEVDPSLWIANLVGQHGLRADNGIPPVRYDAIRTGLVAVAAFAREHAATVHMPRIGAGLAGGSWPIIAEIVEEVLVNHGINVTVYDVAK